MTSTGRTARGSPGTSNLRRHRRSAASKSSEIVDSSKSRPFARCAIAAAMTTTTASCHARCLRRASERESQTSAIPNASANTLAAVGTPGGSTPLTRS